MNKNLAKRPLDMSLSNEKVCALLGKRLGNVNSHIVALSSQEIAGVSAELGQL